MEADGRWSRGFHSIFFAQPDSRLEATRKPYEQAISIALVTIGER